MYKWTFYHQSSKNGKVLILARHVKVAVLRHIKVKRYLSIYGDNLEYWLQRIKKISTLSNSELKLLKKQKGKCAICSNEFRHGDAVEIDHIKPLLKEVKNGREHSANSQTLPP